jgi:outer membrane protein OmpA-like peptidoglycan-associated protein
MHALARALLAKPELRLHIAGHSADDEEPKLSSVRAQAVGAALIAAGAPPNRLRAKGYGPTVPLTALQRTRLRLRSERRVTVHAIAAVRTAVPISFSQLSAELAPQLGWVVEAVAALLREQPQLRLSVEGHADPTESRQAQPELEREIPAAAQGAAPTKIRGVELRGGSTSGGTDNTRGESSREDMGSARGGRVRAASAAQSNAASDPSTGAAVAGVARAGRGGDRTLAHALAFQRSMAVHDALIAAGGVPATRLVHHAFGDNLPVADSQHEEGREANRRVQLLVIPDVSAAAKGEVG